MTDAYSNAINSVLSKLGGTRKSKKNNKTNHSSNKGRNNGNNPKINGALIKSTQPPTAAEVAEHDVVDYSESLTTIAKHTHILEHALPLNRVQDIEASFKAVDQGINDLRTFLKVRGFDV